MANISPSVSVSESGLAMPGVGLPGRILPSGLPRVSQTSPFNNLDGADCKEDDTNFPTPSQLLALESEVRQAPGLCQWTTHSPCPGWLSPEDVSAFVRDQIDHFRKICC